jgi:hypothetical protein
LRMSDHTAEADDINNKNSFHAIHRLDQLRPSLGGGETV